MHKSKIIQLLAVIVSTGGALVMAGWILENEVLKSILPIWATMKFSTALSFFFSGIILYFVSDSTNTIKSDLAPMAVSLAILIILFLMGTLLLSTFLNVRTGIEDLFISESKGAIQTTTPGRPSMGTIISFILIATTGIIMLNSLKEAKKIILIIGLLITMIGTIAIFGYALSIPPLYYSIDGHSSAMAIHTAILSIITGIGFVMQKIRNRIQENSNASENR